MPYLQDSESMPIGVNKSVEIKGKLRNRFYEPIVLLLALTQACMHNYTHKILDQISDAVPQTSEQLFHDFVNKLAQICDNKRGGNTVSALAVLQFPDRVQYRFASNQRTKDELRLVKSFMTDILTTLKMSDPASARTAQAANTAILKKIVAFNRPRLQMYVRALHTHSETCLGSLKPTDTVGDGLRDLKDLSFKADNRELGPDAFFKQCEQLMQLIKEISKSEMSDFFREKANAASSGEPSSWAELRHMTGRMLSYLQAAKTLLDARKRFERLFDDFEVKCLLSSVAIKNPITRKSVNANEIIGRMTHDATRMEDYRRDAESLQKFDLDDNIKAQVTKAKFAPYVHAEVLLHQSILDEAGGQAVRDSQFFNGYRYIGASKPTCRLCSYYFAACTSGVQVRQTHRNLYPNWRAPDVHECQGSRAEKQREDIMNKMLTWIREDTFRTLSDKIPERKQYDSNTDPTYLPFDTSSDGLTDRGDDDPGDLTTVFRNLAINHTSNTDRVISSGGPLAERKYVANVNANVGGGDDIDDDGVILWTGRRRL